MNEFNVLLNTATNGTPSGSLFDALFARYIAPQESWRELESPLPITILAAGEDLLDYRIYGNTENGESVGERTENLWNPSTPFVDGKYIDSSGTLGDDLGWRVSNYIDIDSNKQYTFSVNTTAGSLGRHAFYDSNRRFIRAIDSGTQTFITPNDAAYARFSYRKSTTVIMLTEGSTAPTSYIPFGYKLPMVVRSRNVFNFEELMAAPQEWIGASLFTHCLTMHLKPNTNYTMLSNGYGSVDGDAYLNRSLYFNNTDVQNAVFAEHPVTVTTNSNGEVKVGILSERTNAQQYINNTAQVWCVEGSTAPTSYIPYYRDEENIYIGSDPLAEDEYVSYSEQKIYRMEGGTLTPTDPPTAITALPTIEGETIIDYNPSETPAVEPEKMYVKYKPQ